MNHFIDTHKRVAVSFPSGVHPVQPPVSDASLGVGTSAPERHQPRPKRTQLVILTVTPTSERLLTVWLTFVYELTGGDAFRSAPVSLSDVVLDVLAADAPLAAATDLNGAEFSGLDEAPDEALLHVQLFGCLLDGQEAAL